MRRILFIIMSLIVFSVSAQDIKVVSFKFLEADLTANTGGTIVYDLNGEKCALIKVATAQTGYSFDAGMLGVVKTIQKEGEIWVYVPGGVKRISISHQGMESLRDYDLGLSVQKARTYLLTIKSSKDVTLQTVNFKVSPANATIIIESESDKSIGKQFVNLTNGVASLQLPIGNYIYTAAAQNYVVEEGAFILTASSSRNVNLVLTPQQSSVIKQSQSATSQPSVDSSPVLATNPSTEPPKTETITVNGVSFKMIAVEGGTFYMGSSDGDENQKPVHRVTLSSYHIGETEVTQELWQAVMGSNPSKFTSFGLHAPVERVSWDDCQEFISRLNSLTGKHFRLPTEAEWEYASLGGNRSQGYMYSGSYNIDEVAWYSKNSESKTHTVKTKVPNQLGIYDMTGNVWEWCNDWYDSYSSSNVTNPIGPSSASNRVNRGGSWYSLASSCAVKLRGRDDPTFRGSILGLRLAF